MGIAFQPSPELIFAIDTAKQAGTVLSGYFGGKLTRNIKTHAEDFATEADLASEKLIVAAIQQQYPTDNILAEESGTYDNGSSITWIVDPLDGTYNFADNVPHFGVLIARATDNKIDLGVAYNPISGDLGVAERGSGCSFNGSLVSLPSHLDGDVRPMVGSWPSDDAARVMDALRDMWKEQGIESDSLSSACASGLAILAGTRDAYLGSDLKPWDYSPLMVLFEEAGIIVSNFEGEEINWRSGAQNILGAPEGAHQEIIKKIQDL